jgi:hypothetical protein
MYWSHLRWNCLLKRVIKEKLEGRIEVKGRRGKDVSSYWITPKETRGYGKFKEATVDCNPWRTHFCKN